MQEQMSGAAMAMPADTNKAFKVHIASAGLIMRLGLVICSCDIWPWFQAEWEALELTDHQWALESVEEELMSRELDFDGMFSKELPSGIFWWPGHFFLEPSLLILIISGICLWSQTQRWDKSLHVMQSLHSLIWDPCHTTFPFLSGRN